MTKNSESAIRTLMRAEDVRAARRAIAEGDVNGLDESKRSPLFYAVMHGELGLVTELIDSAANPNIRDRSPDYAILKRQNADCARRFFCTIAK